MDQVGMMMSSRLTLRDVTESDLFIFYEQQLDSEANQMAAFTSEKPNDKDAFLNHWRKIRSDNASRMKTIILDENIVAGYVLSYQDLDLGQLEVAYWIGKDYWGKGVATRALAEFLNNFQYSHALRRTISVHFVFSTNSREPGQMILLSTKLWKK